MRGSRFVNIVAIVAILGAGAACTEQREGVDNPKARLGSKKVLRVANKNAHIGQPLPDAVAQPPGASLRDVKVDDNTLERLGDDAAQRREYAIAATFYDRAVQRAPRNVALHKKLGFTLFKAGAFARAKAVFEAALRLRPDDPVLLRGLGNTLVVRGEPQAAVAAYRRALKASPDGRADHRIYNGLGVALDQTGAHRAAQQAYQRGLARAPGDPSLRNNYALSLAAEGRYARSVRMLERLVRDRGGNARYRRNLERVRAMAAQAGVKLSMRRAPAPRRQALASARTRASATDRRRASRPVGPPRRLLPDRLPDIKAFAARQNRDAEPPAPVADKTKNNTAVAARKPDAADRTGDTDSLAERALLAQMTPGRAPQTTPPPPANLAMQAAALNRIAPGAGNPDASADADEAEKAEAADRLFLRALGVRTARTAARRD